MWFFIGLVVGAAGMFLLIMAGNYGGYHNDRIGK